MTPSDYKTQGHPNVSFEGNFDDVCYLLQDWAKENGHGLWENGGEFDQEQDGYVYMLYDDECKALHLKLEGELVGDTLIISSIEKIEKEESRE